MFHISLLRKSVLDESHILKTQPVELREDLSYEEKPVAILDHGEKQLRGRSVMLVKVLWRNQKIEEATWEREAEIRGKYPYLFTNAGK